VASHLDGCINVFIDAVRKNIPTIATRNVDIRSIIKEAMDAEQIVTE
jgi:hypothetical protein